MEEVLDDPIYSTFPLPECSSLETKEGFDTPIQPIYETLCAFLNGEGGQIFIGIESKTRRMAGVYAPKLEDEFRRQIDTIYNSNLILTMEGETLSPTNIKIKSVRVGTEGKRLFVVKAIPSKNTKYRMSNGDIWYRLSASNFKINKEMLMCSPEEIKTMIEKEKPILF